MCLRLMFKNRARNVAFALYKGQNDNSGKVSRVRCENIHMGRSACTHVEAEEVGAVYRA